MNKIKEYIFKNVESFFAKVLIVVGVFNLGICAYNPTLFKNVGAVAVFNIFLFLIGVGIWDKYKDD